MIRAIAFDWGGIFTEGTFDSHAVENLARLCGVDEQEIARTYYPLMAEFEAGAFDLAEYVRRFREGSGLEFEDEAFTRTFLGSGRERAAMFDLVARVPEDYLVGMLSNNVPVLCDRVRDDPRLARIERFVFSNEIGVRKPDARAFHALTDALGLPPEQTLFVDDNAENVAAARGLGFAAIHLTDWERFLTDWEAALAGAGEAGAGVAASAPPA